MTQPYSKYSAKYDLIWLILRPWIFVPRILYILLTLTFLFIRLLFQSNSKNKNVQKNLSKYLFDVITDLGPCFIKLGQALSTRPDLVNQVWLTELTNLQDNLPPFDHKIALKIVEEELGKPAHELFDSFPNRPIASASLGQVYKARTKNNTYLAVKVQRPNLYFLIRRDVVILRFLATIFSPFLPLNIGVGIGEIIDEFGKHFLMKLIMKKRVKMP